MNDKPRSTFEEYQAQIQGEHVKYHKAQTGLTDIAAEYGMSNKKPSGFKPVSEFMENGINKRNIIKNERWKT